MIIKRNPLTWFEKLYIPALIGGFKVTLSHFFKKKVTMQYPEEKWTVPEGYRGAPYLVKDEKDRTKCVSCQFVNLFAHPKRSRSRLPDRK
jgi:NADH-quinone oxidoreductase subunit I